jgi:hypothetical protein
LAFGCSVATLADADFSTASDFSACAQKLAGLCCAQASAVGAATAKTPAVTAATTTTLERLYLLKLG